MTPLLAYMVSRSQPAPGTTPPISPRLPVRFADAPPTTDFGAGPAARDRETEAFPAPVASRVRAEPDPEYPVPVLQRQRFFAPKSVPVPPQRPETTDLPRADLAAAEPEAADALPFRATPAAQAGLQDSRFVAAMLPRSLTGREEVQREENLPERPKAVPADIRPAIPGAAIPVSARPSHPLKPEAAEIIPRDGISRPAEPENPGPAAAKPQILPPAIPAPPPDRLPAQPSSAPPIHITIGRIEVRANYAAAPSPPPAPRASPVTSLEDYLKQRGGG